MKKPQPRVCQDIWTAYQRPPGNTRGMPGIVRSIGAAKKLRDADGANDILAFRRAKMEGGVVVPAAVAWQRGRLARKGWDYIVPIPGDTNRVVKLFAIKLAIAEPQAILLMGQTPMLKSWGQNYTHTGAAGLVKIGETEQKQKTIQGDDLRRCNVKELYKANTGINFKGKKVLLVDDVATSGGSLSAAVLALYRAGAAKVQPVVLYAFCNRAAIREATNC